MAKVLVMAGTHYRETGFSHPTADLIISSYGGSASKPQEEFVGVDKARKAELWDFGKIAVAKIKKIGEISSEYLNTLPLDRLLYLAKHRRQTTGNGAEIAETFEHESQWTSVHNPLIEYVKPDFFFDLHSHHKQTEGIRGTAAYITPYAREAYRDLIKTALVMAQRQEPQAYGRPFAEKCPVDENHMETRHFTRDELKEVIEVQESDPRSWGILVGFDFKLKRIESESQKFEDWGNQWYFRNQRGRYANSEPDNFCFEAVHWGKENQEATARFVTRYLAELL